MNEIFQLRSYNNHFTDSSKSHFTKSAKSWARKNLLASHTLVTPGINFDKYLQMPYIIFIIKNNKNVFLELKLYNY